MEWFRVQIPAAPDKEMNRSRIYAGDFIAGLNSGALY